MKRDLRLLHERLSASRSNYIEEVNQPTVVDDLPIAAMRFDNCLDQVEGELFYKNVKVEYYEQYLNETKENSQGNLWKYLRDVQHLYEGSHLSKQARTWNLELLGKSQNIWFSWVERIPYPGIQEYCLFYAPSLDCLIDFMIYLGEENAEQEAGKVDGEQQRMLVMLLIHSFIDHMVTIEGNMEWDNRMNRSPEKWDIDHWKNEETSAYIKEFINALLSLPQDIMEKTLYEMLSDEWIFEKKNLRDQYRKKFRDAFLELIVEHYQENLTAIIQSDLWESSKAALHHRLAFYCYWSDANDSVLPETGQKLREVLWSEWKNIMLSDIYIVHMIYTSEDGFWLLWLSGKLLSDEGDVRQCFDRLLSGINMRLDGWNKKYEKSRASSDIIFCIFTVAAMAAEWKHARTNEAEKAEDFYWYIFEKVNRFVRGNRYLDEVAEISLLQIWSRMVLLAKQNPFTSRKDFIWENIRNIDIYEYRVHILDVLLYNINRKNLKWAWDENLKKNLLSMMSEEKEILEKEREANSSYYERYYLKEGKALERCLNYLTRE